MGVLQAPAKLTKSLRILGIREDGYHLIDAEMVSLDLFDELEIEASSGTGSTLTVDSRYAGATSSGPQAGDGDDLVYRALRLADRDADVRLVKHIPPGAGLGGGSSDAAAVLRWAGYSDLAGAATIGADVPYCLAGGRARVGGIGERVEPLEFITETFTLLTPPVHAVTAYVYRVWDEMGGPTGDNGNDLEPAALAAYPELDSYRARLHELSGLRPRLAGSGSTWFVPGAFEAVGTKVVSTIR